MVDTSPAELAAGPAEGGAAPPRAAAAGPSPPDPQRLAEQVADRVYRLMLAEARLSLSRGEAAPRGPRHGRVRV